METTNTYIFFKPTYKDHYIKYNRDFNNKEADIDNLFYCINSDVEIVLNALKISPKKFGYDYWKNAVYINIVNGKNQVSICKDIYPVIAYNFNKSVSSVERAMRLCFESVMHDICEINDNYICNYIRKFLLNPRNSEILVKITDLIVSDDFQRNKYKLKN